MKFWIARDEIGCLYLYNKPPRLEKSYFLPQKGYDCLSLDSELFPEVTLENSPQEVELKLVNQHGISN